MSLLKSAATVGGWTLISRIAGFIRDIVVATMMGTGVIADAFFVAFKIPNLFRRLFAEGAFSAAFVPIFSGKLDNPPHNKANIFAREIMSLLTMILFIVTIMAEISMPFILKFMAPGFADNKEKFDLAVELSRITFPYLLFISLVSLLTGVLNSVGKFAAGAFSPVLLNICMIFSIIVLSLWLETPAHALAWGVFAAGIVQFLWMMYNCYKFKIFIWFAKPKLGKDTKIMLKRMVPGIIGAGVTQINVWVDIMLATLIPSAVSYLYYADRISQFPLAIIGTAIGTAMLPSLSRYIKQENKEKADILQNNAIRLALLFTLPATAGIAILSVPIISSIFEYGKFTSEDSIMSAKALAVYAIGLPSFVLIKIFLPSFFARGDTKTPVKIAAICVLINIIFNLILIKPFGHVGLAAATSIAAWCNASILLIISYKNRFINIDRSIFIFIFKTIFATICMSAIIIACLQMHNLEIIGKGKNADILVLILTIIASIITYSATIIIVKAYRISEILKLLKGRDL